jgi:hypothetical protein
VYNLLWDPAEQYDITFNGAAPTHGDLRTSPGRFAGPDHGWAITNYMTPALVPHFEEIAKYPNRKSLLNGGPFFMIPMENRPYRASIGMVSDVAFRALRLGQSGSDPDETSGSNGCRGYIFCR